jgi:hypothetical protein
MSDAPQQNPTTGAAPKRAWHAPTVEVVDVLDTAASPITYGGVDAGIYTSTP